MKRACESKPSKSIEEKVISHSCMNVSDPRDGDFSVAMEVKKGHVGNEQHRT